MHQRNLKFAILLVCGCITLAVGCRKQPSAADPEKESVEDTPAAEIAESKPVYTLDEAEREFLWDAEHHGNVLNEYGFKPFLTAWQQRDPEGMKAIFPEDLSVEMLDVDRATSTVHQSEVIDGFRHELQGQTVTMDRDAFVQWYLELRSQFADEPAPKGGFYVMKLVPPENEESTFWTVTTINRFWGQSVDGGTLEINTKMVVRADALSKKRLAQPGWFASCEIQQLDSMRTKQKLFEDVTSETGIKMRRMHDNWEDQPGIINTGGIYACDYDRDGQKDLLITDVNPGAGGFYRGLGDGKFKDMTTQLRLDVVRDVLKGAFADLDNDGWEDLLLPNEGLVFRNVEGKRFEPVENCNLQDILVADSIAPPGKLSGLIPGDFDRDGDIEPLPTAVDRAGRIVAGKPAATTRTQPTAP